MHECNRRGCSNMLDTPFMKAFFWSLSLNNAIHLFSAKIHNHPSVRLARGGNPKKKYPKIFHLFKVSNEPLSHVVCKSASLGTAITTHTEPVKPNTRARWLTKVWRHGNQGSLPRTFFSPWSARLRGSNHQFQTRTAFRGLKSRLEPAESIIPVISFPSWKRPRAPAHGTREARCSLCMTLICARKKWLDHSDSSCAQFFYAVREKFWTSGKRVDFLPMETFLDRFCVRKRGNAFARERESWRVEYTTAFLPLDSESFSVQRKLWRFRNTWEYINAL